jgi:hypothetical protein
VCDQWGRLGLVLADGYNIDWHVEVPLAQLVDSDLDKGPVLLLEVWGINLGPLIEHNNNTEAFAPEAIGEVTVYANTMGTSLKDPNLTLYKNNQYNFVFSHDTGSVPPSSLSTATPITNTLAKEWNFELGASASYSQRPYFVTATPAPVQEPAHYLWWPTSRAVINPVSPITFTVTGLLQTRQLDSLLQSDGIVYLDFARNQP